LSLAIVFPNADVSGEVELPLKFQPMAMQTVWVIPLTARWEQQAIKPGPGA
jgi:hypothetical protein